MTATIFFFFDLKAVSPTHLFRLIESTRNPFDSILVIIRDGFFPPKFDFGRSVYQNSIPKNSTNLHPQKLLFFVV